MREQPFSCAPYFHAILIGANDKPISNKLRNFDPPLFQSRIKRVAQPRSDAVMVDFELAVLNAITTSFPDSSKKGCFFHFSQAIFKKIQSLGLQVDTKTICTRIYCDFVPVICVLFVTCKLCDL